MRRGAINNYKLKKKSKEDTKFGEVGKEKVFRRKAKVSKGNKAMSIPNTEIRVGRCMHMYICTCIYYSGSIWQLSLVSQRIFPLTWWYANCWNCQTAKSTLYFLRYSAAYEYILFISQQSACNSYPASMLVPFSSSCYGLCALKVWVSLGVVCYEFSFSSPENAENTKKFTHIFGNLFYGKKKLKVESMKIRFFYSQK